MRRAKMIVARVAAGVLGVGLYVGSAQAGDVCVWDTDTFDGDGFNQRWCDLSKNGGGSGWYAHASSLSGYANPGVKGIIAELTHDFVTGNYTAYAVAQGLAGTQPIAGCKTAVDVYADGQTVSTHGGDCRAATRHRLVVGWKSVLR